MKTLGIIGGMSPESTVSYYQIINRETNRRLGGNSSADIVMHSVNFETVAAMQRVGDWQGAGMMLAQSARKLESMGAQALVLAANTMHKVAPAIEAAVGIPLIHVVDVTAAAVKAAGLGKVALCRNALYHERRFLYRPYARAGCGNRGAVRKRATRNPPRDF